MSEEALFNERYNRIYKAVDQSYDIRGSALSDLVKICLENEGRISSARRDRFREFVPDEYMDFIESTTRELLNSSLKYLSSRQG